ncbi:hypothetical protein ES703_52267 [subsurface metagenome]
MAGEINMIKPREQPLEIPPTSKTVILQWHRGDALVHGTYILDTGMTTKSVSKHLNFRKDALQGFVEDAFGPPFHIPDPEAASERIAMANYLTMMGPVKSGRFTSKLICELVVKVLLRALTKRQKGSLSISVSLEKLEAAVEENQKLICQHLDDGGILLTLEEV